ncbi:13391_t:CDS:2 [Cetraspora pellucida]|uniref:13391_t:CDS:1 n=1 Tax=Cetraspora pellucida TaxID=1433469 RepID=A0A9N9FFJ7_9GLOM|nr:13391_t:CDS:2 [Cetraspora pellucida]
MGMSDPRPIDYSPSNSISLSSSILTSIINRSTPDLSRIDDIDVDITDLTYDSDETTSEDAMIIANDKTNDVSYILYTTSSVNTCPSGMKCI